MKRFTKVKFTNHQKSQIIQALKTKKDVTLVLKDYQFKTMTYDFANFTPQQKDLIKNRKGREVLLTLSYDQMIQDGGFIGALLPVLARVAPAILKFALPAVATGVLSGAASGLTKKAIG